MIPPDGRFEDEPDEVLDLLDGLILAGGNDIDPAHLRRRAPSRDPSAGARARPGGARAGPRAVERDMPVLGICRGMQLINVAFGGTLSQHLPEELGHEEHRRMPGSFDGSDHDVRLTAGSLAARAAGEELHCTKSHHHQGVATLGDGLEVTGHSAIDDLPEAIEAPGRRFVLGVQWHPEADEQSRVVAALVEQARDYRSSARLGVPGGADARRSHARRGPDHASRAPAGPRSRARADRTPRGCARRRAGSRRVRRPARAAAPATRDGRAARRAVPAAGPPGSRAGAPPRPSRPASTFPPDRITTVVPGDEPAAARTAAPRRRPRRRPRPRAWPARAGTPSPRRPRLPRP